MDASAKSPMDDIKKLGEILMKRTSEKEYYRFLHIQEQCCLKWQTTIDKFGQLMKEHERCERIKSELKTDLRHITQQWINEKRKRQNTEMERDFYRNKLHQTYEILRYSPSIDDKKPNKDNVAATIVAAAADGDDVDGENSDELTSTGSFLSDLSDVSATDIDFLGTTENLHPNKSMSMEFNAIFGTQLENSDKKMAVPSSQPLSLLNSVHHQSALEKTPFTIKNSSPPKKPPTPMCDEQRKNHRLKVPSPLTLTKKFLHLSDNFTNSKLYDSVKNKRSFNAMQSCDSDCNPIYEQINDDDDGVGGLFRLKNNLKNIEPKNSGISITPSNSKTDGLIHAHDCQHTFSYHTASRSVACFLCSKKFRFGILAFICTTCKVFVHHNCKSQLKSSQKSRFPGKIVQKYFISDFAPADGPSVPALIVHCVNEVETRGLSETGIYRVSGSEKEIKALKDRFLYDEDAPDLSNVDMHVICGCIKIFLRGLREPLIPTDKWMVFSNAVVDFDGDYLNGNILSNLQFEINQLPKANRDSLAFLILHLQRVATCAAVKMPISNLAKVFGPTVVGYSQAEPDYTTILGETVIQQNVMQHFLNISTDYWFSFISTDFSY